MAEPHGWAIEEYRTASRESPLRMLLHSLDKRDLADALALIKLAEERGNQVRLFYIFGPGRRVITLLSGIIKKQDRIPESALEQARRFKADLEAMAKQPKKH